jgi:hypothetical protein
LFVVSYLLSTFKFQGYGSVGPSATFVTWGFVILSVDYLHLLLLIELFVVLKSCKGSVEELFSAL